jgi:hypothetical protein
LLALPFIFWLGLGLLEHAGINWMVALLVWDWYYCYILMWIQEQTDSLTMHRPRVISMGTMVAV